MAMNACLLSRFLQRRFTTHPSRRVDRIGRTGTRSSSASTSHQTKVVASTQTWFERVVIGEKLCPFAPPLSANTMRIVASAAANERHAINDVAAEVNLLFGYKDDQDVAIPSDAKGKGVTQNVETTLVVFDAIFVKDFRDFVRLSWTLQEEVLVNGGFQEDLQFVLFHPGALHQTYSTTESAADFTIRSPYPTLHLLRQADVMRAVEGGYPNLEEFPARNKEKLIGQGIVAWKTR
jgi:hypothetical protein